MKRLTSILTFLFTAIFANAAVFTVSNNPSSPAQYTTIQAACDAASAGDTIYISGSPNFYQNTLIRKRLTLIGPGAYPLKQYSIPATISGTITLDTIANVSGSGGTKIIGLTITANGSGGIHTTSGLQVNNISIIRNSLFNTSGITVRGSNWLFSENYFRSSLGLNNQPFCIIKNNIFAFSASPFIANSNQISILFDHNLFIAGTSSSTVFSNISNALLTNNIFYNVSILGLNVTNCVFNNNLTYLCTNNNLPTGPNNTGTGNIINQNPLFVNVPNTTFNSLYDYRLQDSSPGNNAGTDGSDVGLFGGSTPLLDLSGMSDLPYVREMNIQNSTIGVGNNLNVQVKARKR